MCQGCIDTGQTDSRRSSFPVAPGDHLLPATQATHRHSQKKGPVSSRHASKFCIHSSTGAFVTVHLLILAAYLEKDTRSGKDFGLLLEFPFSLSFSVETELNHYQHQRENIYGSHCLRVVRHIGHDTTSGS